MKVIYGVGRIKRFNKPVVALGVFDGVHRGHIYILKSAVKRAREIKGTSMVLTFWPHPQKKESLYSLVHRLRLIKEMGIDVCIVVNFNQEFAEVSASDFVKDILFKKIRAYYVYAGKNFRFGKNAQGNFKTLLRFSRIYNFKVKIFEVIKTRNKPISSTYIRSLIKKGKLAFARKLLTRPVSILGTVIKGSSLARELGFPTANIDPHHEVIPPQGVYAVRIIFNGDKFQGVCYIGSRPTFLGKRVTARARPPQAKLRAGKLKTKKSENIEVYIFDFNKNLYANNLEVQFIKKIRGEKKFASAATLIEQIKKDVLAGKKEFSPNITRHQKGPDL